MSLTSFLLLISVLGLVSCAGVTGSPEAANIRIQGAGASFPFPIYSKWFKVYSTLIRTYRSTINPSAAALG